MSNRFKVVPTIMRRIPYLLILLFFFVELNYDAENRSAYPLIGYRYEMLMIFLYMNQFIFILLNFWYDRLINSKGFFLNDSR